MMAAGVGSAPCSPELPRVGIVATSSAIGRIELAMGVERLRQAGFSVRVHPSTVKKHLFWAGTDDVRAEALLEFAHDPEIDVVWCARGGYGVTRILAALAEKTAKRAPPRKKLLVGYSDITALHAFAARRWGWSTLHAPMPAGESFMRLRPRTEWDPLIRLVSGQGLDRMPWADRPLRFLGGARPGGARSRSVEGPLLGGNLSLWAALAGTPDLPNARGAILFFEDVGEGLYRIDRYLTQLENAGAFDGVRALVLGDFTDCADSVQKVLAARPSSTLRSAKKTYRPLRPRIGLSRYIKGAFSELGKRHGIPVAVGLPVGHGPHYSPLPLHAEFRLDRSGALELLRWQWTTG